jgi:ribonuclease E
MRSAGNFSPEWGYLAPAPSFMRTVRVVLVATAVGATAGAAVVLSLVDRPAPAGEATAVAAHAIVTSVQAATAPTMQAPAPMAAVTPPPAATPIVATPAAAKAPVVSTAPTVAAVTVTAPSPAEPSSPVVPQTAAVAAPVANTAATDTASMPDRRAAPGMAALSEASPTSDATASDIPEAPAIAVDAPPPQKKVKHTGPVAARSKPNPTLGSVFGSLFNPHH